MSSSYAIPLFIGATMLAVVMISFMIGYVIVHKNKQNIFLRNILEARVEEHEKTLNDVSQELHDNVGQLLGFAQMNIRFISNFEIDAQKGSVQNADNFLTNAIHTIRHISRSLSAAYIKEKGLLNAISEDCDYINSTGGLNCSIEISGDYIRMRPEAELGIYRIAQEAVNNALKHAQAQCLNIALYYTQASLTVTFSDNGRGFAATEMRMHKSIGLINMTERAKLLNGTLQIISEPESGCTILLTVPVTP